MRQFFDISAFFAPPGPPPIGYPGVVLAPAPHHGLNEIEFEEIMSRNRTVSSSAIARAVQVREHS